MPLPLNATTASCSFCHLPVDLSTQVPSRRTTYRKTGRAYCSNACRDQFISRLSSERMARTNRKYASARMIERNPMHRGDNRQRMRNTLLAMGHKPQIRGGNGTGLTHSHSLLLSSLGTGWTAEHAVKTGHWRGSGYPTVYKLDLAHEALKIGVEVDGNSHGLLVRQEQDAKKDQLLRGLGWTVLRFKNAEVLENLTGCVQTVLSTISKLKALTPTLPMEF